MSATTTTPATTPAAGPVTPVKMKLADAERIALKIRDTLEEFCDRIEIAGSIRRRRETVGDIDLVCLPESPAALTALQERFYRKIKMVSATGREGRDLINILDVPGVGLVQVDLFIAAHAQRDLVNGSIPSTWGSVLLCRTGSTSHNIRVVTRAKDRGWSWNPLRGLIEPVSGRVIAAAEEADIYKALGLDWLEPCDRERVEF